MILAIGITISNVIYRDILVYVCTCMESRCIGPNKHTMLIKYNYTIVTIDNNQT